MGLWDDFLGTFKQRESGRNFIGDSVAGLFNAAKSAPGAWLNETVVNPLAKTLENEALYSGKSPEEAALAGSAITKSKIGQYSKKEQEKFVQNSLVAFDPLLQAGVKAEEYVFSPIARSISTVNLLTDFDSKLYAPGELGKGFQLSDIKDAYNRSANVSLGQSMLKSDLNTGVLTMFQNLILQANDIDVSEVDLWDDESIQKNFVDNPVGSYITGANDFIIKNVAINAAFSGLGAVSKAGAVRAGLATKFKAGDIDAMPLYEKDMFDHLDFIEGKGGNQTVIGQDIVDLAASENIIDITRIIKKHSYNQALPDLIKTTKDPRVVADFLLADKGYGPAIERLAGLRMSDDLWVIGDGNAVIRNQYIIGGKVPVYTAEQRARWTAAFDDSIAKNPKHQEVYDAFLRQEVDETLDVLNTEVLALGKNYKPMEPIIGKAAVAATRSRLGQLKTARIERDWSNVGGVTQTILGSRALNGPTTVLLRQFGTYMPKGMVTNSGLRPMNGIEELISVFDDIPLFRNGNKTIVTHTLEPKTVSEYRRDVINRFVEAKSDGQRALVIQTVNKELARTVAYSRGYYNTQVIDDMVDTLMQDVNAVHGSLRQNGFAMDPSSSVRIVVNPVTQRQLANAEAMLPFGDLDRLILRAARKEKSVVGGAATTAQQITGGAAKSIFEMSTRIFSIAQLYRFSYIPKNSIFEPLLAATLAEGSKFAVPMFTTAAGSAIKKTSNVIMRGVEKSATLSRSAKVEVQKEIKELSKQYDIAVINRDAVYSSYESMFGVGAKASPATKRDWADDIKIRLKDAEKDVATIEAKLNVYAIEYGTPISVPSIYGLRTRIQALKDAKDPRYSGEIAAAEMTLARAVGDANSLAPEVNVYSQQIADAYEDIGLILDKMGPVQARQAELFKVSEGRYAKQPILDPIQRVQLSNGQVLEFKSFANRDGFGEGYMSEISSNGTRTMELLGNKATVSKVTTIKARSPKSVTDVASPEYFDELAFVVNNHLRGDLLVDRILARQTRAELLQWTTTTQGKFYARTMDKTPEEMVQLVDDNIVIVGRYLPTSEAKIAASQGAVNPTQLRGLLADKLDKMSPIHPLDIEYANPTSLGKNINISIDSATSKAWKFLMAPENVIREVWGTSRHTAVVAERSERLLAQGIKIDLSTLNRIHHASAIQVADEVAKVFYTIPRQHRALYLARGLATFPNAAASGIYRYAGFAVKKTKRFAGFLNSYQSLYNSFGVDIDGNPVDNVLDATHILIPGTKEMGINKGKGFVVGARATNYLVNFPGASWIVPVALSSIYAGKPGDEDLIKESINKTFGKIPGYSYEELFPFGIDPDVYSQLKNTFTPAWGRNLAMSLKPDKTNLMFVESWISESNRQWILYHMKKGPLPTDKSVMDGARSIYFRKFRTQFLSLVGSPQYVESQPDSIYQDYFFSLVNQYQLEGKSSTEASKLATEKFQSHMQAETGSEFPMERLFIGAQDSVTYITPSQKAYERIWERFPGLQAKLRQIDPAVIGLMVADLPRDYSPQINKFLNSTTARFPDGTMVNEALKTPQLVEEEIEKSRFWSAYTIEKNRYNEAAKNAGYSSYLSVPGLRERLKAYATETLGPASFAWFQEYQKSATSGNQGWIQSQGLSTVVKDKDFMRLYGKTQFWQHAKAFVQYRNEYAVLYRDVPSGQKGKVKDAWANYLASSYQMWDPVLQRMITRYFENDNLRENK